ncbi:hypothetical protein ACI1S4_06520 [Lactococcus petauri]|uniref:hypothetical protein n=1 Tax=Lactococcus petauri TaxID=1940789 RepID=UPI00254D8C39|nr:hypothetical protein [Lactococcus petauri]
MKVSEFINWWSNHNMRTDGRNNLDETDILWNELYSRLEKGEKIARLKIVKKSTLLFRVHQGMEEPPEWEEFEGRNRAKERYDELYSIWEKGSKVNFNNHWLSFTDDINSIGSTYFTGKGLRGHVIVMSSNKAINISDSVTANLTDEKEIVAPLKEENLIELLPFKEFIKKYGKGTSDYERFHIKI